MAAYSDLQESVDYARALAVKKFGEGARVFCSNLTWGAESATGVSRVTAQNLPDLISAMGHLYDHLGPQP